MPPAPNPFQLAVGLPRGGGGPYTPAAAHRPDSLPAAPQPIPYPPAASPPPRAPPLALGPTALGTTRALRPGYGRTDPSSAPARRQQGAHGAANAPRTGPAAGSSWSVSPGHRSPWPALHRQRPLAGPHTCTVGGSRLAPRAGSGPGR